MRRILIFVATAGLVLAAGGGTAIAAGQAVCIGSPGAQVRTPGSNGQCNHGDTLVTLANQSDVATLQSQVSSLQSDVSTLQSQVSSLQSDNATLKSEVSALQTTLSKVSYDPTGLNGKPTLKIDGANLQIVSGLGQTNDVNGVGNLFIGYDEFPGTQTGSHNLILGTGQTFTSYSGVIGGEFNHVSGPYSAVFGESNTASGVISSVSGGTGNTASGVASSVSGGGGNTASGDVSSVSGGGNNVASGDHSSILGGHGVTVSTQYGTGP